VQYDTAVTNMETGLDRIAPGFTLRDNGIGLAGADLVYATLALIRETLGEPDPASADMEKGEALCSRLPGSSDNMNGLEYFAEYRTLLDIAQGDLGRAAHDVRAISLNNDYTHLLLTQLAHKGEAEKALTLIDDSGRQESSNDYDYLIDGLIQANRLDQAEQVINTIPGNTASKSVYFWKIVRKMANDGNASGAEDYAKQHGMNEVPRDRLRLLATLMDCTGIAADRKQAEPILRKIFAIAEEMDKADSGSPSDVRSDHYRAGQVATRAFSSGYTDLGIELYRAATNKDQRPLLQAFTDHMKTREMTPVLMLAQAQDNLHGQPLQYVIDAGIRQLQKL
jgi:hypothetical protein